MPRPVEALPCGSRSMMRTFSPMAARAVPRLIAVVVLPTPPFWLARARTRGTTDVSVIMAARGEGQAHETVRNYRDLTLYNTSHEDDAAVRVGFARDQFGVDIPRFRGKGQFGHYILSLWKQPNRTCFQQWICISEQPIQWRQRA